MRFSEFNAFESVFDPIVKKVQKFLIDKGYDLGPTGADGIMGPYTKEAIAKYKSGENPSTHTSTTGPNKNQSSKDEPSSSPATGDVVPAKGPVTGQYGRTVTGPNGNKIPHPGVDIGAPEGAPVIAPDDGTIQYAGWGNTAGNLVELITANGVKHRFMHLSKITTKTGASVKKGQQIGNVGNTGFSKGAHLHWEKYASGRQVNPMAE